MQRIFIGPASTAHFLTSTPTRMNLVLIALAAALLGTEGLLRRPLIGEMAFSSIVLAEHLLLSLFAIPVMIAHRRRLVLLSRQDWVVLFTISWGASAGAALLFTKALESGNPTTASLLQNMQPLIVVILAMVILKERISRFYWPCLTAAMLGAYLLSFGMLDPRAVFGVDETATAGYALGAATLWGAGTVLGRIALLRLSPVTLTAMRILLALPFVTAFAIGNGGLGASIRGLGDAPVRLTIVALGPGLVAVLLFYRGLRGTRASHATLAEFTYPVSALVGNWLVLDILISLTQVLGLMLILATLALLAWHSPSTADVHPSTAIATTASTNLVDSRSQLGKRLPRLTLINQPVRSRFCTRQTPG